MRRRALLTRMLPTVALAGCTSPFTSTESYPETRETTADVADLPCPNQFDTAHTLCTHPPSDGPPVSLTPNKRILNRNASDVQAIRVTLTNDTRDEVAIQLVELSHHTDDGWLSKTGWSDREIPTVPSGKTLEWSLSIESHPTPNGVEPIVYDFRPGNWAFTVVVELTPEHSSKQAVELSTVFTVIESGD